MPNLTETPHGVNPITDSGAYIFAPQPRRTIPDNLRRALETRIANSEAEQRNRQQSIDCLEGAARILLQRYLDQHHDLVRMRRVLLAKAGAA